MKRSFLMTAGLLAATAGVAVTLAPANAADPTPLSGVKRLVAAGIDVSALKPGWVIQGNEIVWDGGDVKATIDPLPSTALVAAPVLAASLGQADTAAAAATPDCDSGYVCVYDGSNYGGRRLQIRNVGLKDDMSVYSFNDIMSSWYSRRGYDARWYYDKGGSGTSRCIESGNRNSNVGAGATNYDNDEMSAFRMYGDDSRC